jgi:hypothetical protein
MLTRESLGLIFDELGDADRIVSLFTGLVYPYSIVCVDKRCFEDRLMFLVDIGCIDLWVCDSAAKSGSLECLKYAHSHSCPWDALTCSWAARNLECLKYAHENGCPLNEAFCTWAAKAASLECLKYAHDHGCPWDYRTYQEAANDACFKYAEVNGCPF